MAHALRTPLTSLSLGLGLLRDGGFGALSDRQDEVVNTLVNEVARLSLLVERHLDIDRMGAYAGPVERVALDLAELVQNASLPLARQASERHVRLALDVHPVTVVADPTKLAWVVGSLVGNALRFSPEGGAIDVKVLPDVEEVELWIGDQGPGVAEGMKARLFEREGGTALFLVREIVEAHGGRIRLCSERGQGSTFILTLPVEPPRRTASR